mgnify:CR=1 FL=1
MRGFAYTVFVGLPFCAFMCAIGLILICTVIGAPVGLALIAVGMKKVTMIQPPRYYERLER